MSATGTGTGYIIWKYKEYDPEELNIFLALVCQSFRKEVNNGLAMARI